MNLKPNNFFIFSTLDLSEKSAATTRMRYYAKALAGDKNRVYLISSCSTELNENYFIEANRNVFILNEKKITTNFFQTFVFLRRLKKFSDLQNGSKTFLIYPTAFIFLELLTLIYLKFYKGCKVFHELNEVRKYSSAYEAPMSVKRFGYSIKKMIFKGLFTLSPLLLYFYNGLICISTSIENYGKKFNKNTIRIPILTELDGDIKVSKNIYHNDGVFNIGFSGSIHPIKEDLENFISVIKKLSAQGYSVSFNLCGPIFKTYNEYFLNECKDNPILNYYGFLNQLELSTFLNQQDLLVLPRGYTPQNKYGFSTKLSDYLNHKKMVLVTDISDNSLYVADSINGFVVPPDNKEEMFKKIEYIIKNFDKVNTSVIANARRTSMENFDYRLYTEELRSFLQAEVA